MGACDHPTVAGKPCVICKEHSAPAPRNKDRFYFVYNRSERCGYYMHYAFNRETWEGRFIVVSKWLIPGMED